MGTSPFALVLLLGFSCTHADLQQAVPFMGGSLEVNSLDYGIFRVRVRPDGRKPYEVQDVIEAHVVDRPCTPQTSGQTTILKSSSTKNVVTSSQLTIDTGDKMTASLKVNDHDAITAVLFPWREGSEQIEAEVRFHGAKHVYGIPERATDLSLRDGVNYRLWNLDVFKYELHVDGGLYGTIPLLMALSPTQTVGLLWLNAADTRCQLATDNNDRTAKWSSDHGVYDIFFLPGPTPRDVQRQMSFLTGKVSMPPQFAIGYHQCRWNYRSEDDVLQVDDGFDTNDIPYDVIWLDIEHTDGKRYFTWDHHNFPTPYNMHAAIEAKGRKIVVITDPHIKRASGYHVHDEATRLGHYVKTESGADYEGHCWPGQSSWIDYTSPAAREWYAGMFAYDVYKGSTPITYFWIDMNEPSVFNSHEVTMDRNAVHSGGVKHKEIHNQYGYYQNMATYNGVLRRSLSPPHETPTRPFILSRSFYAGTQKYCAVWTGDNKAEWSHLAISVPMLLALSLSSLPFVGADVGGFFDHPSPELLVRWYQLGAFYPFFRAHAHLETPRREPWLFGEQNTKMIRAAIMQRYAILPFIYTTFYLGNREGTAVLNPLFFEWPTDEKTWTKQDALLVGDALLVHPIVKSKEDNGHSDNVDVYLPGGAAQPWFEFSTGQAFVSGDHTLNYPIEQGIPVFIRGGRIVPKQTRVRRSSQAMQNDPFTLVVALNHQGMASGELYMDDGHSFLYTQGAYQFRKFAYENGVLSNVANTATSAYTTRQEQGNKEFLPNNWVERIVLYGLKKQPGSVTLAYDKIPNASDVDGLVGVDAAAIQGRVTLEGHWDATNLVYTIRKPAALLRYDWTITLNF